MAPHRAKAADRDRGRRLHACCGFGQYQPFACQKFQAPTGLP